MRIEIVMDIDEVKAQNVRNAPYKMVLDGGGIGRMKSEIALDDETFGRFDIKPSLDLNRHVMSCVFESRDVPLEKDGRFNFAAMGKEDLRIKELVCKNTSSPFLNGAPPSKHETDELWLTLESFGVDEGRVARPLPCPYYRFVLPLTDRQYDACRKLHDASVFSVRMKLEKKPQTIPHD